MDKLSLRDYEDLLFAREIYSVRYNQVKNKPCQTRMLAGDVEFIFASRNERFKQIELKIRNNNYYE